MINLVQRRLWWGVFFLGIILLIYMFRVESEPGALPLFLVLGSLVGLLLSYKR
jgi:FtsH-binding integral membrane protein